MHHPLNTACNTWGRLALKQRAQLILASRGSLVLLATLIRLFSTSTLLIQLVLRYERLVKIYPLNAFFQNIAPGDYYLSFLPLAHVFEQIVMVSFR